MHEWEYCNVNVNSICTIGISDTNHRKTALISHINQQKKSAETIRKHEEEIKKRTPPDKINELTDENYDFAFKLNSLCNFIYKNWRFYRITLQYLWSKWIL